VAEREGDVVWTEREGAWLASIGAWGLRASRDWGGAWYGSAGAMPPSGSEGWNSPPLPTPDAAKAAAVAYVREREEQARAIAERDQLAAALASVWPRCAGCHKPATHVWDFNDPDEDTHLCAECIPGFVEEGERKHVAPLPHAAAVALLGGERE
jgi:hypothetical protein